VVAVQNNLQGKSLDGINALATNAARQHWTPEQTVAAINAYRAATTAATQAGGGGGGGDPLGVGTILKQAGPIVLGIAAIVLLPPILQSLRAGRRA
jgi:hypothetical protein